MARIKNVKFKVGGLYTLTFAGGTKAFVKYLKFKKDNLYFEIISSTDSGEMLYPGKVIKGEKHQLNREGTAKIRNMNKTEMVLYGKRNT